jgi:DNA polymerase I-like protein with 3'-5' exonuclease and polymerase domains
MKGFPGIARYQEYCRKEVMKKGYILLNPITRHKAYIYDWNELSQIQEDMKDQGFWEEYREAKSDGSDPELVYKVRHYFRRKAASEKQSINYRIQNRGAMAFKLASIKLFNYLKSHNLLFIVKYCIPAHDEINIEAPEAIADEMAKVLLNCMVEGGKPFCSKVYLGADLSLDKDGKLPNYWIH